MKISFQTNIIKWLF